MYRTAEVALTMAVHDSRQSALRTPYAQPEGHGTLFCRLFNDPVRQEDYTVN